MEDKLISWIIKELEVRGWSRRELARKSGLSHAYVANVLRGDRDVTWHFCLAVANGLGEPVWKLFIMAGLLNEVPTEVMSDEKTRLVVKIFNELSEPTKEEALSYLKWLSVQRK